MAPPSPYYAYKKWAKTCRFRNKNIKNIYKNIQNIYKNAQNKIGGFLFDFVILFINRLYYLFICSTIGYIYL